MQSACSRSSTDLGRRRETVKSLLRKRRMMICCEELRELVRPPPNDYGMKKLNGELL